MTKKKAVKEQQEVVAEPKETGRPSAYTKELAEKVCLRMMSGDSLRKICLSEEFPDASTIHRWVLEDRKENPEDLDEIGFYKHYAHAREVQAEQMFDEILEIADQSDKVVKSGAEKKSGAYSQNQRLKVDTRKWYLSKVLPKKFGDKLDLTSGGEVLPAPIFDINVIKPDVLPDHGNEKDSETNEED